MKLRLTDDGDTPLTEADLRDRVTESVTTDRPVATLGGLNTPGMLGFFANAQEARRDNVGKGFVEGAMQELKEHLRNVRGMQSPQPSN